MAIYSVASRTVTGTTTVSTAEFIAGASRHYRLLEIGLSQNAATAGVFGFGTPAAIGVTPTSPITVLIEEGGITTAGATTIATAWGTAPTQPTNFFRRWSLPANIGAAFIETFPRGLTKLLGTSTVLFNIAATPLSDFWIVVDE